MLACALLFAAQTAAGQEFQIGIIDVYGLQTVSASAVRGALTFKEGDTVALTDDGARGIVEDSVRAIQTLPGVSGGQINIVCCDAGRVIVYVGVQEEGQPAPAFRSGPSGSVRLPADIVAAGAALGVALDAALQAGDMAEDQSRGHALSHAPGLRAVQDRFIVYARRDEPLLRRVLRESSDAGQRGLAAQVLGYVGDKQGVVPDLVAALGDPDANVRNNALRALWAFTNMTSAPAPRVPYAPIVGLLNSPVWTDRNKASAALDGISRARNPELLAVLRRDALDSLVEMARWKSPGHAGAPFRILGRLAGRSEAEIDKAWTSGEIEPVIAAARAGGAP